MPPARAGCKAPDRLLYALCSLNCLPSTLHSPRCVMHCGTACMQVSDIKRVNGILSDSVMFAREHIKIPTGIVPMRWASRMTFAL